MMDQGAEAILLGGTDLNAAFDRLTPDVPILDCAHIPTQAIAQHI